MSRPTLSTLDGSGSTAKKDAEKPMQILKHQTRPVATDDDTHLSTRANRACDDFLETLEGSVPSHLQFALYSLECARIDAVSDESTVGIAAWFCEADDFTATKAALNRARALLDELDAQIENERGNQISYLQRQIATLEN
jgi:hypothetical protein